MDSFNDHLQALAAAHQQALSEQAIAHASEIGRLRAHIEELRRSSPTTIIVPAADGDKPGIASSEWVEWNGGECPAPDSMVDYIMRDGETDNTRARLLRWDHIGSEGDIVAYRLHRTDPAGIDSEGGSHD